MVWQNTLELLPQSLITTNPQVNQELPFCHNYKDEEGGKAGKDEDLGGDFCHSEGPRYRREDQGGEKQKDEEGAGWHVLFSTHLFVIVLSHFWWLVPVLSMV